MGRLARGAGIALALALLGTLPAHAARSARSTVDPGVAKLGERVIYRGSVVAASGESIRFMKPEPDSLITWGEPRFGRTAFTDPRTGKGTQPQRAAIDTVWVEVPFQIFETGVHMLPGLRYVDDVTPADSIPATVLRLPQVRLTVIPTLTPADSNSTLREVHGPLAAPWWERVPWMWVIIGLLVLAAIVWLIRRLRKRKPVVAPAPVAKPAPRRDPVAEALADLRALRARALPEAGEFSEHAFVLGRILRRFLESTVTITRPGDTTPELIAHLKLSEIGDREVTRLSGLLRVWDRIKFARDPFTAEEAHRAEDSVEAFVQASAIRRKEVA